MDVTCVTAPQDVAADMGPTVMCPRTHTDRRAHQLLQYPFGQDAQVAHYHTYIKGETNEAQSAIFNCHIPEEFYDDFDTIRAALTRRFVDVVSATEAAHVDCAELTDKGVGLYLSQIKQPARQFIFARRKHGPTWHALPKFRTDVCRTFRPTANVLAGYSPSAAMHRFADDA